MSHQSDWGYCKQPIKLPLVKVNHVFGDFILILERSFFFYKQKQLFMYWPYYDALFAMDDSRTLWMGFKRVQDPIIS